MITQPHVTTADDLLHMPDDGYRYELIEGELIQMSPAGSRHGRIAITLAASLFQQVKENNLGVVYAAETGFKITSDPDTVRAPDAAFVSRNRHEAVGNVEGFWPGAPDLAAEVVSPGDTFAEVEGKVLAWLGAGTRMVIVVDPRRRTASVYRSRSEIWILTEHDYLDGEDVVPGWRLQVKEIFT